MVYTPKNLWYNESGQSSQYPGILPGFDPNPGFPDSALESRVFMNAQTQTRFEPPNHDVPT